MDNISELFWHTYPATLLIALGLVMIAWSLSWEAGKVLQESLDPRRALALVRSLRIGLVGLSLVGIGVGWLWNIESLLVLSLIFGCEELYETSVVIAVLKSSLCHNSQQAQA